MARRAKKVAERNVDLVVAYLRVSTEEQAKSGAGIAAQRATIEQWAKAHGKTIVDWFIDDGASGKNLKREKFIKALEMVDEGVVSGIVTAKLDRLTRSILDFATLMARAGKDGWKLIALDVGLDTSTPMGEMMANILAVFAQWERKVIGQRTKDGLAAKKAQGVVLGRRRQISDADLATVAVTYMRCDGNLTWTAEQLNKMLIPTAQGGKVWRHSQVSAVIRSVDGQAELLKQQTRVEVPA